MPLDYDQVMRLDLPEVEQKYAANDTILYALGIGLGQNPTDEAELRFVYEKALRALPTMICVLAHPPFWIRDRVAGVDWAKVVHGEQSFRLHRPLPAAGAVRGKTRVRDVVDKGPGKGAIIYAERSVTDAQTGELVATVVHTAFCRGDGGFGGPTRPSPSTPQIPDRAPDLVCDLPTRPESALIYRLSGDYNPLHAEPAAARAAGYPAPILHGLATFGVVGHAILKSACGYEPDRLLGMSGRFAAPVFPGETVRTEMWRTLEGMRFRARVAERDTVVLSNGEAEIVG